MNIPKSRANCKTLGSRCYTYQKHSLGNTCVTLHICTLLPLWSLFTRILAGVSRRSRSFISRDVYHRRSLAMVIIRSSRTCNTARRIGKLKNQESFERRQRFDSNTRSGRNQIAYQQFDVGLTYRNSGGKDVRWCQ